ncbi:MAG: 4a-hydroxytetrahydrobiopterin dehydratase [Candidatus Glassbacteria bacterium]
MGEPGELIRKKCKPCKGGVAPLTAVQAQELLAQIPDWHLHGNEKISRRYAFADFRAAQAWLNRVADLAEAEDHHPDITWNYSKVLIELSTHAIGGLSENDFILAAKIDRIEA